MLVLIEPLMKDRVDTIAQKAAEELPAEAYVVSAETRAVIDEAVKEVFPTATEKIAKDIAVVLQHMAQSFGLPSLSGLGKDVIAEMLRVHVAGRMQSSNTKLVDKSGNIALMKGQPIAGNEKFYARDFLFALFSPDGKEIAVTSDALWFLKDIGADAVDKSAFGEVSLASRRRMAEKMAYFFIEREALVA